MARGFCERGRLRLSMVLWVTSAMFASPALALNVRVESIRINDQAVDQAPAVIVISAQVPQGERRTLRKEDVFAAGFELVAPAMTLIVLRSDNGNRILLEPGARLRVADITATGERYLLRRGSILFEVVRALSFFNVEFEEKFVAQVRGTRFRVTGKEDGTFTCEVLEGRLVVQRPENIRLGRAERIVSATTPVALDQNGKRIAQWSEADIAATRSFADLKDAQRYLTEKTEQARSDSLERALVLGALFAEGGKQSVALAIYTQAEEDLPRETPASPQLAELYVGKAQLLARMNRAQEALAYYDLARRVYNALYTPDTSREIARVLTGEAEVHTKLERYDVAAEKYNEAIAVETRFSLGAETPRIRRNIEALEKLHRLAPKKVPPPRDYRFAVPLDDPLPRDAR
jgi:hypothetical protein